MRTLSMIAALVFLSGTCAHAESPDMSKPISIDQALEIAFRQSPAIKTALNQVRKSDAGVSEARANFNPQFSAQVVHMRQGPEVTIEVPGMGTADIVASDNTTAEGAVFLPLDINKRLGYVLDLSNLQFRMDYLSLSQASQQLVYEVKSGYYDLLRAAGLEEVAQAAVDVAKERLKDAKANFSAGATPKFDVTRAEVEVANLNQRLIVARNTTALARASLNRTLGIDVNTPTQVVEAETVIPKDLKIDIPAKVGEAHANRPEIKQAELGVEMGKKGVKVQRAGLLPSMDLAGSYDYALNVSGFSSSKGTWAALLTLRVPIWNGGITSAKIRQAEADEAIARNNLEQVRLGVALEVRAAALNLQEAVERVATTADGVALAEEALRLASVRYNAGYSTMVEVSDAESALTEARFYYVQAKYNSAVAQADLERATATQPEAKKIELLRPAVAE